MIQERFKQAIADAGLLAEGERILAAVSGGGDSVALLLLLADYAAQHPGAFSIVVAHVNHKLRGEAADADQRFVERLSERLQLPCLVLSPEGDEQTRRVKRGEEGARMVRHALLRAAARAQGCRRIALGHTADDQAETVLMRLVRGSGRRGLSGMAPCGPGRLFRPMLGIRRREAREFLAARGEPCREDETNLDPRLLRNRIRSILLPLLAQLNPSIVDTLSRNATLMAEEDAWLDGQAAGWVTARATIGPDGARVSAAALEELPRVLARRAVRLLIARVGGDPRGAGGAAIESVLRAAGKGAADTSLSLPGGMRVTRDGLNLYVGGSGPSRSAASIESAAGMALSIPGVLALPGDDGSITARLVARSEVGRLPAASEEAALDAASLGGQVTVRTRRPGDTFHPLGAPGHRKLKEFLIDCKVPRFQRDQVLLVVGPSGIAWVVGHRIGHGYRVTEATQTVAMLRRIGRVDLA